MPVHYVQRVEQGRQGCNPRVAQKLANVLGVDLKELRAKPDEGDLVAAAEAARPDSAWDPPFSWLGSPRYLHKAYVKVLLK